MCWVVLLLAASLICPVPAFGQINISALEARAAGGDAEAHNLLGNAYVNGQGVERDMVKATMIRFRARMSRWLDR